jgi:ABC-type Na+ efflux pump permease subunit
VANKLQNRYDEFECKCWFDNVAYSILPCEIHSIIGQSMGISVEKERLYEKIMRQNQKREKLSDQRMNKLLLFMTVLAMSSAIWDACCLIEGMYSFDLHQSQLFIRIVTYVVLFVIFIIMFLNYRRQDR